MNETSAKLAVFLGPDQQIYSGHVVPTQNGPMAFLDEPAILKFPQTNGGVMLDATLLELRENTTLRIQFYVYRGVLPTRRSETGMLV